MFTVVLRKFSSNERLIRAADFVLEVLFIYLLWKLFLYWVNKPSSLFHSDWMDFNDWLAAHTVLLAAIILKHILGYGLVYNGRNIIITGTEGLYVANHCLGVPPAVIFAGFIIAYGGRWLYKFWYIPFGIFCIYLINVLRVVALGITEVCCYKVFFELAHSWVYVVLCYGMFFLLITWWMNTLSKKQ